MRFFFPVPAVIVLALSFSAYALQDTLNTGFFRDVKDTLWWNYRDCTGDSAPHTDQELLQWRHMIDSIADRSDFDSTMKKYMEYTKEKVIDVHPCQVILWKLDQARKASEVEREIARQRRIKEQARLDSAYTAGQLAKAKASPCDFNDIPFGVSKRCFLLIFGKHRYGALVDKGVNCTCDTVSLAGRKFSAAFHFSNDSDTSYYAYEVQGCARVSDSLDRLVRPDAEFLSSYFERRIGSPPEHLNRIGFFDIKQGVLSIYTEWTAVKSLPTVYVGLATYKYKYYAKAVVKARESEKAKESAADDKRESGERRAVDDTSRNVHGE